MRPETTTQPETERAISTEAIALLTRQLPAEPLPEPA